MNDLTTQNNTSTMSEDVQLSRILLLQGKNDLLKQLGLKDGAIINDSTREVIADDKGSVELIPLALSSWWDWHYLDGKKEWVRSEPRTNNQKDMWAKDYKETVNGRPAKPKPSVLAMVLFCDEAKGMLPAVLRLKKSSYWSAGKTLATLEVELRMAKLKLYDRTIQLSSGDQSFDGNDYKVFQVKRGKATTAEQKEKALGWASYLSGKPVELGDDEGSAQES